MADELQPCCGIHNTIATKAGHKVAAGAPGWVTFDSWNCTCYRHSIRYFMSQASELALLDSLLRDTPFLLSMAEALHAAHYASTGEAAPAFIIPEDAATTVPVSATEAETARHLTAFYALESGVGWLCSQSQQKPATWLRRISTGEAGDEVWTVLHHFAHATQLAGLAFSGMEAMGNNQCHITTFANPGEKHIYTHQLTRAAKKLVTDMAPVAGGNMQQQLHALGDLLHHTAYAVEMADYIAAGSVRAHNQPNSKEIPPAPKKESTRSAKDIKIATNIAGFYALESGLTYLATTRQQLPSVLLSQLIHHTISNEDELLFARLANATWKAGQPFRNLERITRPVFTPFYFLTAADIAKDKAQIRTAAAMVWNRLQQEASNQDRSI